MDRLSINIFSMYQKGFSNVLIIIFGILIGIAAIGLYSSMNRTATRPYTPTTQPSPVVAPVPTPAPSPTPSQPLACGIHVTSPMPHDIVTSTINVAGYIDGGCHWSAFEGTAGNVRAYDANGNPVSAQVTLGATSDWMTLPVYFSARVVINTPPQHVATGYLLFQNDDASGQFPETFQVPIRF
jgi:hypothetical protein